MKALFIGTVADIAATFALSIPLVIAWTALRGRDLLSEETELALATSVPYLLLTFLVGSLGVVVGGCVAARIAQLPTPRIGVYYAGVTLVVSRLFEIWMPTSTYPTWYWVLSYMAIPVAAVAGAALGAKGVIGRVDGQ